jgi:hypothetical protein
MMNNLKKVWVTMEPCKDRPGWCSPTGYHLTEPLKWYTCYQVPDPIEFIAHMRMIDDLPTGPIFCRMKYETLCRDNDITPLPDECLRNSYDQESWDFKMSHYHTDPRNRKKGLAIKLHRKRYLAIKSPLDIY